MHHVEMPLLTRCKTIARASILIIVFMFHEISDSCHWKHGRMQSSLNVAHQSKVSHASVQKNNGHFFFLWPVLCTEFRNPLSCHACDSSALRSFSLKDALDKANQPHFAFPMARDEFPKRNGENFPTSTAS